MPEIVLPNNWTLRPYQKRLWSYLEKGGSRAVAVWHRRAGAAKTMFAYIGPPVPRSNVPASIGICCRKPTKRAKRSGTRSIH